MRYTVVWEDAAVDDLARAWMGAPDRKAVRVASHQVDIQLAVNPETKGEEFYGDRLVVIEPLHVTFTVLPDDLMVKVLHVWRVGS
jgi:hypothetical protein